MRILVTGSAGFIGFHLTLELIKMKQNVIGIDSINNYYSKKLKYDRLAELGIERKELKDDNIICVSKKYSNFSFILLDISNKEKLNSIFKKYKFDKVCHLAAQAGVRYSIQNPSSYIESNLVGFSNILESVRNNKIDHLIYASSSSVYGESNNIPFSTDQFVDRPISLYAATKKSNELMAHSYSHLYDFATTGLRFFTVYGPWGRPDMAYFLFVDAILKGKQIKVFNEGNMYRDFTYIDDIINGIISVIKSDVDGRDKYKIYNIGNNETVRLSDFIKIIEKKLNKTANKKYLPLQPGDVTRTFANINDMIEDFNYKPNTNINDGLKKFILWYIKYFKI